MIEELIKSNLLNHGQKFDDAKHKNLANMLEIMYKRKIVNYVYYFL